MAKDTKLSDEAVNAQADALAPLFNNGYRRIYSGTKPATVATAITDQTLLAELRFGATAYGSASAGVITANAMTGEDAAIATGTAAWFRDFKSDGTTAVRDGTVGTTSDFDLQLSSVSIVSGVPVSISSHTHTVPKASS